MSIFVPPRPVQSVGSPSLVPSKAGPIGPGAGVLQTEFPLALLASLGRGTPQERMKRWIALAEEAGWPSAAENAIATAILRQPWVIEDQDEVEVDDTYSNPLARACFDVMDRPSAKLGPDEGAKYTRSELWRMTLRHAGICGSSFWFKNRMNTFGQPESIKYIAPWRMTPNDSKSGNLQSWQLDKAPNDPGIELSLEEVIHFFIYPPDVGHFGRSQMEIALLKVRNDAAFDKHVAQVLSAGGRLSGFLSPPKGESINDEQYNQLVNDARAVVEQQDAAKRLQIMKGPVEFTQTTMTIADLQIADLLKLYRDDTLSLWGVPPGYLVAQASGLNSGEARKYDKQVLWENAVHARVEMLTEALQLHLVDLWDKVGLNLTFEIEEPAFDDDSGRFDLVAKSLNTPMRNRERRALVNLEPFGDAVINPVTGMAYDDEVWLPATDVLAFVAPEEGEGFVPAPPPPPAPIQAAAEPNQSDRASAAAGETKSPETTRPMPAAKADIRPNVKSLHATLTNLRKQLNERYTDRVKDDVAKVLEDQRKDVTDRARARVEHMMRKPNEPSAWSGLWDDAKWDRRMREALAPTLTTMAETLDYHIRATLSGTAKAGPVAAVNYTLTRGGTRITALNDRTKDAVLDVVRRTVAAAVTEGLSPSEAGDRLEEAIAATSLENGVSAWDEYRAEMVARTEMTSAYNDATLGSYQDLEVTQVQAIDGDGDEECAARDGETFDIDEAQTIEDHPNGTLDWVPIIPEEKAGLRGTRTEIEYDDERRVKAIVEYVI